MTKLGEMLVEAAAKSFLDLLDAEIIAERLGLSVEYVKGLKDGGRAAEPVAIKFDAVVAVPHMEHSFGSWTITKTATVLEKGEMKRVCSVCGYEETKSLAKKKASDCILLAQGKLVSNGLKLTWLKYEGATGYEVYSAICGSKSKYKLIKDTTKRTYTHTGLKCY